MKYCIHCGSELEDEDKFCVHCGLSQSPAPEPGCQQEAVGQTSVSPASAAGKQETGQQSGDCSFCGSLPLRWWLSFAWFCSCVSLRMKGRHPLPMLHRSSRLMILTGSASSHDSKSSDSSVASKKESSSAQTEVSVRALSGFSGEMSTCPLNSYSASSVLPASEYGTYIASNLSDGDWSTAWVEGSSSSGAGQSVTISRASGGKATVSCLELVAGYGKSTDIYYKNARPKQVSLIADSGEVVAQVTLADSYRVVQSISFPAVSTSSITLRIDSVYEGNKYDDCAISEMRCF